MTVAREQINYSIIQLLVKKKWLRTDAIIAVGEDAPELRRDQL